MKLIRSLAFLLAVVCAAHIGLAADIYVHAVTGNDTTGTGASGAPYKTLAKVNTLVASGDNVYLAGEFDAVGSGLNINGLSSVLIAQWSGQDQAWIKGSVRVPAVNWSLDTGNTYKATVTATIVGAGFGLTQDEIDNGDVSLDGDGRPQSLVQKASSLTNVRATTNRWWQESNTFYINLGGLDPSNQYSTDAIEYCVSGMATTGHCITAQNCTNCTISGIKFRYLVAAQFSNYFVIASGTGNVIEDCVGYYNGRHHFGFVDSGSNPNTDNTLRRTKMYGGGVDATAGTLSVFYANGTDVIRGVVEDCEFYIYQGLDIANNQFNSTNQDGGYCHTAQTTKVQSIRYSRDYFKNYIGSNNRWVDNQDMALTPSVADRWDRVKYGAVYEDCTFVNGGTVVSREIPINAWFTRCLFTPGALNGTSMATNVNADGVVMFESCHIVAPMPGGVMLAFTDQSASAKTWVILLNSNIINSGNTAITSLFAPLSSNSGNGGLSVHNCILQPRSTTNGVLLSSDSTTPNANLDFSNNQYSHVGTFSALAARNEQSEWFSAIDTGSAITASPAFVAVTTSPQPTGTSAIGLPTITAPTHSPSLGFNGRNFSNHYGAWQFGQYFTSDGEGGGGGGNFWLAPNPLNRRSDKGHDPCSTLDRFAISPRTRLRQRSILPKAA